MPTYRGERRSIGERLTGIVDGTVKVVSPAWACRRQNARAQLEAMRGAENFRRQQRKAFFKYEGADTGHRLKNWIANDSSADAELDGVTHGALRDRSNERLRNTGLANTIINSITENVVGHGLEPSLDLDADRLGITDSEASELRDQADEVYRDWAPHADSTNRLDIADLQSLALASTLVNGDMGILPIHVEQGRAPSPLGLKLEMIESHRIATPFGLTEEQIGAGITIRHGVSLGKRRQPLGYWISNEHPGDGAIAGSTGSLKFRRVSAHNDDGSRRFLHLYSQKRVGQTRGEPMFAPVLADFKDLYDWKEAELVAAQVAACFAVFITQNDAPYGTAASLAGDDKTPGGKRAQEVIPGGIFYGLPGETVQGVDPGRPVSQYEAFYTAVARQICSVSGMPLEVAMRDFSNTTYSQARAALLEARRSFANRQDWLVRYMMAPVWDRVLLEAWLRGKFDAGDFLARRSLWTNANWETPGWGHIDEMKSMQAADLAIRMRVTTRSAVSRQLTGKRWSAINRQLAREEEAIAAVGGSLDIEAAGADPEVEEEESDDAVDVSNNGTGKNGSIVETKLEIDALGAAVRAGVVTPQTEDEVDMRNRLKLPAMGADALEAWDEEGGVRRPVTLTPPGTAVAEPEEDNDTDNGDSDDGSEEENEDE